MYSYGLTLWQTVMDGEVPYNGLSRSAIEVAKTEDPRLTKLVSQLPPDTPLVLRRCIELATKYMPWDRTSLDDIKILLLFELAASQRPAIESSKELGTLSQPNTVSLIDEPWPKVYNNSFDGGIGGEMVGVVTTQISTDEVLDHEAFWNETMLMVNDPVVLFLAKRKSTSPHPSEDTTELKDNNTYSVLNAVEKVMNGVKERLVLLRNPLKKHQRKGRCCT